MIDLLKKYKKEIGLVSTCLTVGGALFMKIDAYAQSKVDAGVEALRMEHDKEITNIKADIQILKAEQQAQKEALNSIDRKQDDMIHLLLEIKRKDGGQ